MDATHEPDSSSVRSMKAPMMPRRLRHFLRRLLQRLLLLALGLLALSVLLVLALRWIPPPGTALMVERKVEAWRNGEALELRRQWLPWEQLPGNLQIALVAAEDQRFAEHWGFDLPAIRDALEH